MPDPDADVSITSLSLFLILGILKLWDVADDQDAVDLILDVKDAQEASEKLLQHALSNFSTDNTSVMVIRLDH